MFNKSVKTVTCIAKNSIIFLLLHALLFYKQYELVLGKGVYAFKARKVSAGLAESHGSQLLSF